MELGTSVLVSLEGTKPFEGVATAFAGEKVQVYWSESVRKTFRTRTIRKVGFFPRTAITPIDYHDPHEDLSGTIEELWNECLDLGGGIDIDQGRWTHGDHKDFPVQGKICWDKENEVEVKAKSLIEWLQKAVLILRDKTTLR